MQAVVFAYESRLDHPGSDDLTAAAVHFDPLECHEGPALIPPFIGDPPEAGSADHIEPDVEGEPVGAGTR